MRVVSSLVALLLAVLAPGSTAPTADPSGAAGAPSEEIRLWPGDAPGSAGLTLQETVTERSTDPSRHDRAVTGVLHPRLTVYHPASPNGAAVIVVPGGAFQRVVIDKEGADVAEWLNGLGVAAFVLTYRLPDEGHAAPADVPLQDGQRAVRILRDRAEKLGIDPSRIGIIGFSAGAQIAGSLAAFPGAKVYAPVDGADRRSARPDFVILVYPAVGRELMWPPTRYPELREVISKHPVESGVSPDWPPTFLLHAADDPSVPAEGSVRLFEALRAAGVPAELHVFQRGGHGFGIRHAEGPVAGWPKLCSQWMAHLGVLTAP